MSWKQWFGEGFGLWKEAATWWRIELEIWLWLEFGIMTRVSVILIVWVVFIKKHFLSTLRKKTCFILFAFLFLNFFPNDKEFICPVDRCPYTFDGVTRFQRHVATRHLKSKEEHRHVTSCESCSGLMCSSGKLRSTHN